MSMSLQDIQRYSKEYHSATGSRCGPKLRAKGTFRRGAFVAQYEIWLDVEAEKWRARILFEIDRKQEITIANQNLKPVHSKLLLELNDIYDEYEEFQCLTVNQTARRQDRYEPDFLPEAVQFLEIDTDSLLDRYKETLRRTDVLWGSVTDGVDILFGGEPIALLSKNSAVAWKECELLFAYERELIERGELGERLSPK